MAAAAFPFATVFQRHGIEQWRSAMVMLWLSCSFVVFREPAPVDLLFPLVLLFFMRSGLGAAIGVTPILILLCLYNFGGVLSAIPVMHKEKVLQFVVVSAYMAVTAVFLAFYLARDPVKRFEPIKKGLLIAAVCAALIGIYDFSTAGQVFTWSSVPGRATGFFKDPNVFSTFLILPCSILIFGLLTGRTRRPIFSLIALLVIVAGVFLSFSRGAWANLAFTTMALIFFAFVTSVNPIARFRIIAAVLVGGLVCTLVFAVMMSFENIRDLFLLRFQLFQSYDSAETGRFGNQVNSLPLLVRMPLGMGPLQFDNYFIAAPHNTFINAFASYGWLGGFSYIAIFATTLVIGFRSCLAATPFQHLAIIVYCPLFATFFQGIQIDMDHWRHFYWMIGLMWGIFAAVLQYRPNERAEPGFATLPAGARA